MVFKRKLKKTPKKELEKAKKLMKSYFEQKDKGNGYI